VNRRIVFIVVACFCVPTALLGQYSGRHGGSNSGASNGTSTAPADSPDLADLKRAVAAEATDEQEAQFGNLAKCTDIARQKTQTLRQSGSEDPVKQASAVQDAVDEVQHQLRDFLRTFSDEQVSILKKQTKKLNQSDATVMKESKKLAAELERNSPNPHYVEEVAANLQQALVALESDQKVLGTAMGIGTH
jgi:hypothetical protein